MLFGRISPKVPSSYGRGVRQVQAGGDLRAFQEIVQPVWGGEWVLASSDATLLGYFETGIAVGRRDSCVKNICIIFPNQSSWDLVPHGQGRPVCRHRGSVQRQSLVP